METLTNCPVCAGIKFQPFISCFDHTVSRETFHIVQCEACGFRFTNPRPDEKEIGKYYKSEEYISHSGTSRGIVNKIYGLVRNYTIKQKVKLINKISGLPAPKGVLWTGQSGIKYQESKNILDIGCGTGEFLHACKMNGWNVTGVEPSDIARKHAKENYGIEAMVPEKFFEIKDKKFNVITLWHVLEHVHQLDNTINQIDNILLTNGTLILAVPNCNSWDAKKYREYWAAWDVPRHLYHFTEKDITALLKKYNFVLREIIPMKFDSYYVSLLSEKCKTGKSNLVSGFSSGLLSNMSAGNKSVGFSSQIYVFSLFR